MNNTKYYSSIIILLPMRRNLGYSQLYEFIGCDFIERFKTLLWHVKLIYALDLYRWTIKFWPNKFGLDSNPQ